LLQEINSYCYPYELPLKIKAIKSECGIYDVQGGSPSFGEELTDVPFRANVSYKWRIISGGSTIQGPDNQYIVNLTVPTNSQPITISVQVTIDSIIFTDQYTFVPLERELAERLEKYCKLLS
jgi:hypothetical protein